MSVERSTVFHPNDEDLSQKITVKPTLSPKKWFGRGNCGAPRQVILKKAQAAKCILVV